MSELKGDRYNYYISGGDIELDDINDYDREMWKTFSESLPSLPHHKFGSIVYLGTGGSTEWLNECKEIFENSRPLEYYEEDALDVAFKNSLIKTPTLKGRK